MQLIASPLHVLAVYQQLSATSQESAEESRQSRAISRSLLAFKSGHKAEAIFGVAVSSQRTKCRIYLRTERRPKRCSLFFFPRTCCFNMTWCGCCGAVSCAAKVTGDISRPTRIPKYLWANLTKSVTLCHEFVNGKQPQKWNAFPTLMTNKYPTFLNQNASYFHFLKTSKGHGV